MAEVVQVIANSGDYHTAEPCPSSHSIGPPSHHVAYPPRLGLTGIHAIGEGYGSYSTGIPRHPTPSCSI